MKFTIHGRLPGINEAFNAARTTGRGARSNAEARMRREYEDYIIIQARRDLRRWRAKGRVILHYTFYEKNRCRDLDNISGYAHKLVQDALVKAGYLNNDGWNDIAGFTDTFEIDKRNPRIEVEIQEL